MKNHPINPSPAPSIPSFGSALRIFCSEAVVVTVTNDGSSPWELDATRLGTALNGRFTS